MTSQSKKIFVVIVVLAVATGGSAIVLSGGEAPQSTPPSPSPSVSASETPTGTATPARDLDAYEGLVAVEYPSGSRASQVGLLGSEGTVKPCFTGTRDIVLRDLAGGWLVYSDGLRIYSIATSCEGDPVEIGRDLPASASDDYDSDFCAEVTPDGTAVVVSLLVDRAAGPRHEVWRVPVDGVGTTTRIASGIGCSWVDPEHLVLRNQIEPVAYNVATDAVRLLRVPRAWGSSLDPAHAAVRPGTSDSLFHAHANAPFWWSDGQTSRETGIEPGSFCGANFTTLDPAWNATADRALIPLEGAVGSVDTRGRLLPETIDGRELCRGARHASVAWLGADHLAVIALDARTSPFVRVSDLSGAIREVVLPGFDGGSVRNVRLHVAERVLANRPTTDEPFLSTDEMPMHRLDDVEIPLPVSWSFENAGTTRTVIDVGDDVMLAQGMFPQAFGHADDWALAVTVTDQSPRAFRERADFEECAEGTSPESCGRVIRERARTIAGERFTEVTIGYYESGSVVLYGRTPSGGTLAFEFTGHYAGEPTIDAILAGVGFAA